MRENGEREVKWWKILAKIFWGKWEMVFEWATVISNSSTELTWQHRRNGSHRVQKFTLVPLSYVTQKQKTTFCCFQFSSLSLNSNWVWVMKTGRENQAKHSKLCESYVILKLRHMTQNSLIQTGPQSHFFENWIRKLIQIKQLAVGPTNFRN